MGMLDVIKNTWNHFFPEKTTQVDEIKSEDDALGKKSKKLEELRREVRDGKFASARELFEESVILSDMRICAKCALEQDGIRKELGKKLFFKILNTVVSKEENLSWVAELAEDDGTKEKIESIQKKRQYNKKLLMCFRTTKNGIEYIEEILKSNPGWKDLREIAKLIPLVKSDVEIDAKWDEIYEQVYSILGEKYLIPGKCYLEANDLAVFLKAARKSSIKIRKKLESYIESMEYGDVVDNILSKYGPVRLKETA